MPDEIQEKEFSTERRGELADEGKALPDGSFPIENESDLKNAIQAIGRAKDRARAMAHIKKRARTLGLTDLLPEGWKESYQTRASVLRESLSLLEGQIDDSLMAIRGVTLIKAGFSKNIDKAGRPRYYSPAVLQRDGISAFDGAVVHVNHPGRKDLDNLPEGDALGVRGWYENVRWDGETQSIKGDQILVDRASTRSELWPIIKAAVSSKPDLVELSINAIGQTSIGKADGRDAVVIESIIKGEKPNRVDIVTAGAAGGSYSGAIMAADDSDITDRLIEAMPFEQWRAAKPDYIDRLKKEWATVRETEALKTAESATERYKAELATLQEKYQADTSELAQFRRAALADRILEASQLPFDLRKVVREDLLKLETEQQMSEAIERERAKYAVAPKDKISVDRGNGQPVKETTNPIVRVNPAVPLFHLNEAAMPREDETAEEYRARRLQEST